MTDYNGKANNVLQEVKKVVIGKDKVISKILMAIIAKGHILIDDIPGVGKTTIAVSFAKAMGVKESRMQFTPDVLPSDVTGFSVYNRMNNTFEFREGAVMCNLFLADEINRTSPKTQSALLQVMEEGRVTVEGVTRELPKPFNVIATQNPTGSIGTQKLPESQLDRFMIKLTIGYPSVEDEVIILKGKRDTLMDTVNEAITQEELIKLQKYVNNIHVDDSIYEYVARIAQFTRSMNELELGISTRASIAIVSMAKASAFMKGNNYVKPSDIQDVLYDTICHRIVINRASVGIQLSEQDIINTILKNVKVPTIE